MLGGRSALLAALAVSADAFLAPPPASIRYNVQRPAASVRNVRVRAAGTLALKSKLGDRPNPEVGAMSVACSARRGFGEWVGVCIYGVFFLVYCGMEIAVP